jgi:hypothetical protein
MTEAQTKIQISELVSGKDWAEYWGLQQRIYAHDPQWVAPLQQVVKAKWSKKNAWLEHARAQAWLARMEGQVVGSISAHVDSRLPLVGGQLVGQFGQFESIDQPAVAKALLTAAKCWLRSEGCAVMQGPFDLHINDTCGLLVEGFDTPPMMMMAHQPAYYRSLLENSGLETAIRLFAYRVSPDFEAPRAMLRLQKYHGRGLRVRPLNTKRYSDEMVLLRSLFNDAWRDNWGFVPFSESEFRQVGHELRPVLVPEFTSIAELDGKPVGFLIALPNINELTRTFNGRLLPFNWLQLVWNLKRGNYHTARVPLMGVASQYHQTAFGALVAFSMMDAVRWPLHRRGVDEVEMSWILETNQGMNSLIEALGGERYKTYEILQKVI